ncbi:MAG: 5'-nucleotidase C-terminal domain-containing protein, partial [Bacteroidales bacterium]
DKVDFALTNFGGIRTFFPKGELTLYYVYAAFPFENSLVLVSLPGKHVIELFDNMASNRVEALSGVKLVIEEGKVTTLFINGQPVDEKKTYNIATIDFLLGGGDRMTVLSKNIGTDYSGITLRDVMLQYITAFYEKGEPIPAKTDKRVVVIQKDDAS